jgi:hypothetical protein
METPDRNPNIVNLLNYSGLTGESLTVQSTDNPVFAWPGYTIRQIDGSTTKMQRGFMRSILADSDVQTKLLGESSNQLSRRLWFQFNPDFIERAVSQAAVAMNPLLQSPTNLIQAVPGTSTFGFTLQFNREMEVARGTGLRLPTGDTFDFNSLLSLGPERIGVLADLLVFDNIIGQGVSPDVVKLLSAYWNQQTSLYNNSVSTDLSPESSTNTDNNSQEDRTNTEATASETPATLPFDESRFETAMSNIYGNSAFLNPLPVRVVFSDLFMVEGLITATNVGFQKFSQSMVPTVCQINISMEALYFGFAKKRAFLTQQLQDWATDEKAARDEQTKQDTTANSINRTATKQAIFSLSNTFENYKFTTEENFFQRFITLQNKATTTGEVNENTEIGINASVTVSGDAEAIDVGDVSPTVIISIPNIKMFIGLNGGSEIEVPVLRTEMVNGEKGQVRKTKDKQFTVTTDFCFWIKPYDVFNKNFSNTMLATDQVRIAVSTDTYATYTNNNNQTNTTDKSNLYRVEYRFAANETGVFLEIPKGPILNVPTQYQKSRKLVLNPSYVKYSGYANIPKKAAQTPL